METEQEYLGFYVQLGFEWRIDPLEKPSDPAVTAFRLYILPSFSSGLLVTTRLAPAESRVQVGVLPNPAYPPTPEQETLCRTEAIAKPQEFRHRLDELSVWDLPDGDDPNSRDGILLLHVSASSAVIHTFRMGNPHRVEDPRYVDLVNLYSNTFLSGQFAMKHSWTPPLTEEQFRQLWEEQMRRIEGRHTWIHRLLRWARSSARRRVINRVDT
jgi:hypothetical protein